MKKRKVKIYKILIGILGITIILFIALLIRINLLPEKYLFGIAFVLLTEYLILNIFTYTKKPKKVGRNIIVSIEILTIIVLLFGSFYIYRTINLIDVIGGGETKTQNYSVIVLTESTYKQLKDLNKKDIGYLSIDKEGIEKSQNIIESEIDITAKMYNDPKSFENALIDCQIEAMVLEDSYLSIIEELDESFRSRVRIIYNFSLDFEVEIKQVTKEIDVTRDTFSIYISGIDTFGSINSVSRSDVNMVVTINPKTYQVLLIHIPRDYYVTLPNKNIKDKLTHAGIYGIDVSIKTMETLLKTDINYYAKLNFSSLIKVVDAIGGVDVYSAFSFDSEVGYYFNKGYNHVTGEQALAFVRTRNAFTDGDITRGKNQQAVIEAIIRKVSNSSTFITKYDSILKSLENSFQTSLGNKEISNLAKLQLSDMPKWNVTSISLTGSDGSEYTYTYSGNKLYVMIPNQASVQNAIDLIKKVKNGEKLDSSYGDVSNVKNPETVTTPVPKVEQPNSEPGITTPDLDDNPLEDDLDDNIDE